MPWKETLMPARPRPILAIRLIGPAADVTARTTALVAQLTATYGGRATCRTSTHHASHTGELRCYITVTPRGTT
jgi:hypothetical protein